MLRRLDCIARASARFSTCPSYVDRCFRALHTSTPERRVEVRPRRHRRREYPFVDHTPYIDPSSLKRSLENVRAANRAGLIRKVYQDGESVTISLPHPPASSPKLRPVEYKPLQESFEPKRSISLRVGLPEYAGNPQPLKREWQVSDGIPLHLAQPWLNYGPLSKTLTAMESLSSEVEAFARYMTTSKEEQSAADRAILDIQNAISSINDGLRLELVGSRASGLAMPLSDLDFNVVTHGSRLDDILQRTQATISLRRLKVQLRRDRKLSNVILIKRARIPIIRGVHIPTGLEFQIQHTTNAYNSTQYVKMFLKEYPTARDLFVILRHMLIMRGLSDGSKRGLSSYPLFNMILASLKFDEQYSRPADVGSQLLSFLKMYSEIDFDSIGLTVTPAKLLPKVQMDRERSQVDSQSVDEPSSAPRNTSSPYAMYLRDPADPSNDLGRTCALMKHVQATFLASKYALDKGIAEWSSRLKDMPPKPLLEFLVGDYTAFELERASLRRSQAKRPGSAKDAQSDTTDSKAREIEDERACESDSA